MEKNYFGNIDTEEKAYWLGFLYADGCISKDYKHLRLDIGIIDTMKDLLVNFVGAVVFSTIGYFYIKNRGQYKFIEQFIPIKRCIKKEKT